METIAQRKEVERVAVLIPAYREEDCVVGVVHEALKYLPDVIVVDDASNDRTVERAQNAGAIVLKRGKNGGKGAALTQGFQYVLKQGFDAVIALDADGFHDPGQIPKFLETYQRTHIPVLIGSRMAQPRCIPLVRRWSIRAMSYWLYRLLGVYVPDPPCGFRFYRCDVLPFLLGSTSSLPAEFETLLHIASRRIRVGSVRITKRPHRHKSWISPFRDVIRFFRVLRKYYKNKAHGPVRKRRFCKGTVKAYLLIFFVLTALLTPVALFSDVEGNEPHVSRGEKMACWLENKGLSPEGAVCSISTLPIVELRGSVPVGLVTFNLPWWEVYLLSVVGNMIPIPFLLLLLGPVSKRLMKFKMGKAFFDWLFTRTRKKSAALEKYEALGLTIFVAIPLPVTGAWTGAMAAFLMGIPFWKAMLYILLGVVIAGVIMTTLSLLGWIGAAIAGLVLMSLVISTLLKNL